MDQQRLHRILRLAALAILLSGLCLAERANKPRCSAKLRGRFWPEEANSDARLALSLSRSGQLEMCTVRAWRYRWETLTVHIRQLEKERGRKGSEDRLTAPRLD